MSDTDDPILVELEEIRHEVSTLTTPLVAVTIWRERQKLRDAEAKLARIQEIIDNLNAERGSYEYAACVGRIEGVLG